MQNFILFIKGNRRDYNCSDDHDYHHCRHDHIPLSQVETEEDLGNEIMESASKEVGIITTIITIIREGVKKKSVFFRTLSKTMGRWGSKVLHFSVKKNKFSYLYCKMS